MPEKEDILNELKGISSTVAAIPKLNVFTVDAEYFSSIETELKARITADNFYASQNMFSVPEGYFEGLETAVLQKIKAEEIKSSAEEITALSPLIAGIGNRNIFTVPEGYFEQNLIPAEIKKPAEVIKISRLRTVYKYAAAAVVAGLIGIGVINIIDKKADTYSAEMAAVIKAGSKIATNGTFEAELNSVSGNEIEQYLKQNGQDVNAALVASVTDDEANLPEATDYLFDENMLDNFLNTNNLKN